MGLCYSKEPLVKGEPDERRVGCFHRKPRRKHDDFYQNNEFCVPPKKGITSASHHSSTIPVGSNHRLPSCCSHLGTTTNSSVSPVPYSRLSMGCRQASTGSTTERESLEEVDNVDLVASLKSSPLFHSADEELIHRLASLMQFVRYFDGDIIIQKGQKAKSTDCIYCVASGEVTVKITNSRGEYEGIIKNAGWVFGESSVVFNSPRSMSVVAHGDVKLYTLSKIDFLNSMQNAQKIRVLKFLRKLPFLHSISDDKLIEFSPMIEIKEFDKGDLILDQRNQKSSSFYIIRRGTVSMVQEGLENDGLEGGSDLMEGDELNRGDFFGLDEEIGATYHASSSPTEVLTIKHEHLQKSGNISLFWKLVEDSLTAILNDLGTVDFSSLRLGNIASQKYLKLARQGDVILEQGQELKHLFLVVQGRISFIPKSTQSSSSSLIKSLNGTLYFGEEWTHSSTATGSIMVTSTRLQYLQIPHKLLTQGGNSRRGHGPNSRPMISERIQNAFLVVKDLEQRPIEFQQLKQYRVVGEGQYGKVRLVVHRKTGEKYALKIIQKNAVRDLKTVEHIIMERRILSHLSGRNFLVGFHGAFQDQCALYLLMDWIPGGELFSRITMNGMLPESHAVFYAANVVLAFNTMHRMSIVYRDLKPENILIDRNGFLRLSDYGFATIDDSSALTICGTPDYQAPEIILRKGAQKASDYWALGILIFEMLTGDAPFKSDSEDPLDSYRKILSGKFHIPSYVSSSAAALITDLLQVDPMRRLGYQSADGEAIKSHPWFRTVDWEKMENQKCRAPFIPRLASALDTSCFDRYDDSTNMSLPSPKHDFFSKDQDWAKLWTWIDTF